MSQHLTIRDERHPGRRWVGGRPPPPPPRPPRKPFRCWIGLMATSLVVMIVGCQENRTATSPSTRPPETPEQQHERIERAMSSVDHIFDFHRLGRTTSIQDGVARLNDWQRAFGEGEKPESAPLSAEIKSLLSNEQLKAMGEPRFTLRDGEHVRDCLLARAVSTYGPGSGQTELAKVTHLFGHIVRTVGLVTDSAQELPLTPYEFCLLGKGTPGDRAWMFSNVLRQMRIDAVLLFPRRDGSAGEKAEGGPFLVGVLLSGAVYLFDPANGVPVPAVAGGMVRPATLAEATADPAVLKQLDAGKDREYPITAADLARPRVAIVGDPAYWSGRMQALQTQFVGARAMVISDPLQDSGDGVPGLWSRVVRGAAGGWEAADVRIWEYPDRQLTAHGAMNELQQATLSGLLLPFGAYKHVQMGPNGQPVLVEQEVKIDPAGGEFDPAKRTSRRTTTGEQMRARIAELSGDFAEAISTYTDVRLESKKVFGARPGPADRILHARAIDDATYWTALCKYEQGEFQDAADKLEKYLKQPEPGAWAREARYLRAVSLASAGDQAAAAHELQSVEPDDPEYAGYRLLVREWSE